MPQISQNERIGEFISPLGKDVLALARFDGAEGLSELFEYRIEALSEQENIDFDSALGQNCALKFRSPDGPDRYFNGVLVEARWVGARAELYVYQLVLRPWFWLMSRTSDCRIWHEKTAVDIIKEVFRDRGFTDYQDSTTKGYPTLEYCVQYRETDLNFVSRLMEQHGMYYFFKHNQEKHELVIADSKSSHKPIPGHAKLPFFPQQQARRDAENVYHWTSDRQFRTGKYELNDYDFKKPSKDLTSEKQASAKYQKGKMEIYDYPGKYVEKSDGETYANVRLEADQAHDHRRHAAGDSISMFPGGLTTLDKYPVASENKEYLVVRGTHSFVAQSYRSGGGGETDYMGSYEFQDAGIPYRAPLLTPKPLVHGPQTAKVVADKGKEGEEIDVDEFGRILVLFHWDRKKMKSCRVRVAQVWAGKQWGGQIIPRIGMEALVEFLEGDPDRPLVVGTVYNGDNKHPYTLPDNKTQSGLKSDSSIGHGGYNEFMFEDKKDAEKIVMHGQKDHEVTILNLEKWDIGEKFTGGTSESRTTTLHQGSDKLTISTGNQTIDIAMNLKTTANVSIKLVCGASSIEMTPAEIKVTSGHIAFSAPKIDWN